MKHSGTIIAVALVVAAIVGRTRTAPVQGTHWDFGPEYGRPTGTGDYQAPREFSFSVGVRF
ncbi:MAG TPA: hypothetical protein VNJ02_01680 [Vicinamibacterales bacterium]|nr:hypothetical protein [Vicinamibacterales bacterium]